MAKIIIFIKEKIIYLINNKLISLIKMPTTTRIG
jgi:hypothetical protein